MSPSKMRKTRAYAEGRLSVDGAESNRDYWTGDYRMAYDLGVLEREAELRSAAEREECPLRQAVSAIRNLSYSEDLAPLEPVLDAIAEALEHLSEVR